MRQLQTKGNGTVAILYLSKYSEKFPDRGSKLRLSSNYLSCGKF